MRSAEGLRKNGPRPTDLTARARIRDAAVRRFGREGFDTGLRGIAEDAGVSPGLILHHFGAKAGLREACDEHVLSVIREQKFSAVSQAGPDLFLSQLAEMEEYAPLLQYVLASLSGGGALAQHLVDHLIADAMDYLAAGEAAGTVRPSRDPEARARHLVVNSLGGMLLHLRLYGSPSEAAGLMRDVAATTMLPALELYTEGLFTDRRLLEAYLQQVPDPPPDTEPPGPAADRSQGD